MITQLTTVSTEVPLWYLFLAGFIGISAMILPGLSGAYILFIMGVYQTIVSHVRQAQDLIMDFSQEKFIQVSTVLGIFILGIVVGIKVFAKFLSWLLKRYPEQSIAVLIGLMLGAINKVWPWQNKLPKLNENAPEITVAVLPQNFDGAAPEIEKAILLMLFGFVLLFALERSKALFKK
jgi:putative membrane protein